MHSHTCVLGHYTQNEIIKPPRELSLGNATPLNNEMHPKLMHSQSLLLSRFSKLFLPT